MSEQVNPTNPQTFVVHEISRSFLVEIGFPEETVDLLRDQDLQIIANAVAQGMQSVFIVCCRFMTEEVLRERKTLNERKSE